MEEKDEETSGGGSSGDGDGLFLRPGQREWNRRVCTGHILTSLKVLSSEMDPTETRLIR
jgi:hypothetical protein